MGWEADSLENNNHDKEIAYNLGRVRWKHEENP
jgi:hypothetical protein